MVRNYFLLFLIFFSVLFISGTAYSQHTLQWGIYSGLGINIPPVRPTGIDNYTEIRFRSGVNFSWGFDLLYTRREWGLKSELGLSHRIFYDPNSLDYFRYSYFGNYLGASSDVELHSTNLRLFGFYLVDEQDKELTRYYLGFSLSHYLWLAFNHKIVIEKAITSGVDFTFSEGKYGSLELGFFYDYCLSKSNKLRTYGYGWTLLLKRNSIFRIQFNYHPNLQDISLKKKKKPIKTPRYTF